MTRQGELFSSACEDGYYERVTAIALSLACRRLSAHRSRFSRRDFTRRQQLAILVLRALRDETYRGICEFLRSAPGVRDTLGLRSVPHFTTLQKFADREDIVTLVDELIAEIVERLPPGEGCEVAIDSTGLSPTCASRHDVSKRSGRESRYVKVSVAVTLGAVVLPCAAVLSWGPGPDLKEGYELAERAALAVSPSRLYADRGYDSERLHELLREGYGVESVIPPVPRGPDRVVRTKHRSRLHGSIPKSYGRRWHVEGFFSGMKRVTGESVRARGEHRPLKEASLKVLAYAVHR